MKFRKINILIFIFTCMSLGVAEGNGDLSVSGTTITSDLAISGLDCTGGTLTTDSLGIVSCSDPGCSLSACLATGLTTLTCGATSVTLNCVPLKLIISEYVEGSGANNKAIELFNLGNVAVDLTTAQCSLYYYNAPPETHTDVTLQIDLVGTIQPNSTFTVCPSNIVVFPAGQCDQLNSDPGWFNGDDPVELSCANASQDWLGQIGVGGSFAQDITLQRKCEVSIGDTVGDDVFVYADEWVQLPVNDVSGLNSHCP